jgi:uncharacterized membrane protein
MAWSENMRRLSCPAAHAWLSLLLTARSGENIMNLELITMTFDDEDTANDAYTGVRTLQADGLIDILDAAMLVKHRDGTSQIRDTQDVDGPHGRLLGIIAGGLIGLVGGPAGALIGAVAGGATGAVSASLVDFGFLKDDLRALMDRLSPGSSALVVLVESIALDQLEAALASYDRPLIRRTLTSLSAQDLASAHDSIDELRANAQWAWDTTIDEYEAELARINAQLAQESGLLAAEIDAQNALDAKVADLRTRRDAKRQELHSTIQTRIEKLDAAIAQRRAHLAAAIDQDKVRLKAQVATFQTRRAAAQQKLEASYQAQQDEWQEDIDALKARAAQATADRKAKFNAEIAALEAKRDAAKLARDQRKAATVAAANDLQIGVRIAHDDLEVGREVVRDDLKHAYNKASSEYQ